MWRVIRLRSLSSQSVGVCYWEPLKNFADKKKYREFSHYRFYEYNKYKRPEKQTRALKFRLCLDTSVHLVEINTWMPWICTCEILNSVTIRENGKTYIFKQQRSGNARICRQFLKVCRQLVFWKLHRAKKWTKS